ncbi:MAG: hypothetical protein ABI548_23825 [Polyangiaceae bacterium]
MSAPGSHPHAARIATGELARRGWPRLASLVGGHVASFGNICWQTDTRLSEELRRPDGRRYHPESIARARRQLRDAGLITSERVFVGGKIPSLKAKWASSRGTTVKTFNWRAIEQKNPFSRREQRVKRQEQARASRGAGELQTRTAPRYVSVRAIVEPVRTPAPPLDPELAGTIGKTRALTERWQARAAADVPSERSTSCPSAPARPPPE